MNWSTTSLEPSRIGARTPRNDRHPLPLLLRADAKLGRRGGDMVLRVDWIPVGERLPDKFERCWVSDEVSGIEEAVIDGRGRWAPHDDDYRSRPQAGLHHVTHWAEFETPEPPILP